MQHRHFQRQGQLDVEHAQRHLHRHQHRQRTGPHAHARRARQTPGQPPQIHRRRNGPQPVRHLDGDTRCAIEHTAFVIHPDPAPEREAFAEVVRRPPLADAAREIVGRPAATATGQRRVIGTDPAAKRDLQAQHRHARAQQPREPRGIGQRDRQVGCAPGHPHQQREHQHAAEQMAHHHDGLEQQRHRPHAQQRLEDHHCQRQHRRTRQIDIAPAQRRQQQDGLARDRHAERQRVPAGHVQRNGQRHQHRGSDHLGDAHAATAHRQQRQHQHLHPERAGQEAVHLLAPGLVRFQRPDLAGHMRVGFVAGLWPGDAAIAGRPVRAAHAGIGQPHERPEQDRARSEQRSQPGHAMEVAEQCRWRKQIHRNGLTSVSAA